MGKTNIIKQDDKVYANRDYLVAEEICKTSWSDSVNEKKFPLPNQFIKLGDKSSLDYKDIISQVGLIGIGKYIKARSNTNSEAYIDLELSTVTFVACKCIKAGEEITYNLHYSCFENVKI